MSNNSNNDDEKRQDDAIKPGMPQEIGPHEEPFRGFVKSIPFTKDDPGLLASGLIRQWRAPDRTIQFWSGSIWEWHAGVYKQARDDEFRARVQGMLQAYYFENVRDNKGKVKHLRPGQVTAVIDAIKSQVAIPSGVKLPVWLDFKGRLCEKHTDPLGYIALANGIVGVSSAIAGLSTPEPLNPLYFSTVLLPYEYDPVAECPRFEAFLSEIMEGDPERVSYLQEFIGYCLIPETCFHTFTVLEGVGANGKSVLLEVIEELLGRDNVSHVPLERFAERFALASTIGKLANVINEAEDVPKGVTGILKQFTAGDRMTLDLKHKTPVEVLPTARLLIASNARLRFSDSSEGLWRRMVPIPCRVVIPKERQNPNLASELCAELPGIFNFALKGLGRLLARGRFEIPSISKDMLAEYKVETNSARRFLEETYTVGDGEIVGVDAYIGYRGWCEDNGEVPVSDRQLGREVKAVFPTVTRLRQTTGERRWFYKGLVKLSQAQKGDSAV